MQRLATIDRALLMRLGQRFLSPLVGSLFLRTYVQGFVEGCLKRMGKNDPEGENPATRGEVGDGAGGAIG
jgi:hypothetical protein